MAEVIEEHGLVHPRARGADACRSLDLAGASGASRRMPRRCEPCFPACGLGRKALLWLCSRQGRDRGAACGNSGRLRTGVRCAACNAPLEMADNVTERAR